MHHAELDATLEWPVQVEVVVRLHQMHVKTEHVRLPRLYVETGAELVAVRRRIALVRVHLVIRIGAQALYQGAQLLDLPDDGAVAVAGVDGLLASQLLVEILDACLLFACALLQHDNALVHGLDDLLVDAVRILRRRGKLSRLVAVLQRRAGAGLVWLPSLDGSLLECLQHELHVVRHIRFEMLLQLVRLGTTHKIAFDAGEGALLLERLLLLLPTVRAAG